jgi:hypothetical protein
VPAAELDGALVLFGLAFPCLTGLDLANRALRPTRGVCASVGSPDADAVLVDRAGLGGDLVHVGLPHRRGIVEGAVTGAFLLMEAIGWGRATLGLVLLPGLLSAGIRTLTT